MVDQAAERVAKELLDGDRLLTPGEVAALFRVDPKTVTRWAAAGKLNSCRTMGGHRRFRASEVRALLHDEFPDLIAAQAAAGVPVPQPAGPEGARVPTGR